MCVFDQRLQRGSEPQRQFRLPPEKVKSQSRRGLWPDARKFGKGLDQQRNRRGNSRIAHGYRPGIPMPAKPPVTAAIRFTHQRMRLFDGLIHRRGDQILEHLYILGIDHLGLEGDVLHL